MHTICIFEYLPKYLDLYIYWQKNTGSSCAYLESYGIWLKFTLNAVVFCFLESDWSITCFPVCLIMQSRPCGCAFSDTDTIKEFFIQTAAEIASDMEEGSLTQVFTPVLDVIKNKFLSEFTLMHPEVNRYINLATFFTQSVALAEVELFTYIFCTSIAPNLGWFYSLGLVKLTSTIKS